MRVGVRVRVRVRVRARARVRVRASARAGARAKARVRVRVAHVESAPRSVGEGDLLEYIRWQALLHRVAGSLT